MGLVYDGQRFDVPGARTISYLDDPRCVPQLTRVSSRRDPPRIIVLHSLGSRSVQTVTPGAGTPTNPCFPSQYANTGSGGASYDFVIRVDGAIMQMNDPRHRFSWHATNLNPRSIGIEIQQGTGGAIYAVQIEALVRLLDALTARMGEVPRQIPWHNGKPDRRVMERFKSPRSGSDYAGIVGHRNADDNRGDPGDGIFHALKAAGYEGFDLVAGEDKAAWRQRQADLGVPQTGVFDAATRAALAARGYPDGQWVRRNEAAPIDTSAPPAPEDARGGEPEHGPAPTTGGASRWLVIGAGALAVLGALAYAMRGGGRRRLARANPNGAENLLRQGFTAGAVGAASAASIVLVDRAVAHADVRSLPGRITARLALGCTAMIGASKLGASVPVSTALLAGPIAASAFDATIAAVPRRRLEPPPTTAGLAGAGQPWAPAPFGEFGRGAAPRALDAPRAAAPQLAPPPTTAGVHAMPTLDRPRRPFVPAPLPASLPVRPTGRVMMGAARTTGRPALTLDASAKLMLANTPKPYAGAAGWCRMSAAAQDARAAHHAAWVRRMYAAAAIDPAAADPVALRNAADRLCDRAPVAQTTRVDTTPQREAPKSEARAQEYAATQTTTGCVGGALALPAWAEGPGPWTVPPNVTPRERFAAIVALATREARTPFVLDLAARIAAAVDRGRGEGPARDFDRAAAALAVVQNAPTIPDPAGVDLYKPVAAALTEGEDCDGKALALCALLLALGVRPELMLLPQDDCPEDHLYVAAWIGGERLDMEPTINGARLGESPRDAAMRLGVPPGAASDGASARDLDHLVRQAMRWLYTAERDDAPAAKALHAGYAAAFLDVAHRLASPEDARVASGYDTGAIARRVACVAGTGPCPTTGEVSGRTCAERYADYMETPAFRDALMAAGFDPSRLPDEHSYAVWASRNCTGSGTDTPREGTVPPLPDPAPMPDEVPGAPPRTNRVGDAAGEAIGAGVAAGFARIAKIVAMVGLGGAAVAGGVALAKRR